MPLKQMLEPSHEERVKQYLAKLEDEEALQADPLLMARLGLVSPRTNQQSSLKEGLNSAQESSRYVLAK